jgi:hypothetical protein
MSGASSAFEKIPPQAFATQSVACPGKARSAECVATLGAAGSPLGLYRRGRTVIRRDCLFPL